MHRKQFISLALTALPVIVTQYTAVLMQFIDAWLLGRLGATALAALASAGLAILLFLSFGTGFLAAVITKVSQSRGSNEEERGALYGWQGIYCAILLGAPFIAFWPLAENVFSLMGSKSTLLHLESEYFRYSLLSLTPQLIVVALSYYFIGIQVTRLTMFASFLGLLVNTLASSALVLGLFSLPQLGVRGAALGTLVASFAQVTYLLLCFFRSERASGRGIAPPKLSIPQLRSLGRLGIPAALHASIDVLSWGVILILLIKQFDESHQAAAAILVRCIHLAFLPADGFASTMMSLVGHALGANRIDEARTLVAGAFRIVVIYMFGLGIILFIFRVPFMEFFAGNESDVVDIGSKAIVFVALFQFFDALNVTYTNALYAAGDTLWPSAANLVFCICIFVAGGTAVVSHFPHWGSLGIWFVATIYIAAQGSAFYWRWKSHRWIHNLEAAGTTAD